jgi:hypothetical protein
MPVSETFGWRESYWKAIQESDHKKLTGYVHETEAGIFKRLRELASSADHHEERDELRCASADLLAIKTYKLGWPEPKHAAP